MTRVRPVGLIALGLAQGRRVVLVLDRPPPRPRGWPPKRMVVVCAACFVSGCAGGWL